MFSSSIKYAKKRKPQHHFVARGEESINRFATVVKRKRQRSIPTMESIKVMTFAVLWTILVLLCACCVDWKTLLTSKEQRQDAQQRVQTYTYPLRVHLLPRNMFEVVMCSEAVRDQGEDVEFCSLPLAHAIRDYRLSTESFGNRSVQYNTHRDVIDLKRSEYLFLEKFRSIARPWTNKDYITHFMSSTPSPLTNEDHKQHQSRKRYLTFGEELKATDIPSNTISGMDIGFDVAWALVSEQLVDLRGLKKRRRGLGRRRTKNHVAGSIAKKRRQYSSERLSSPSNIERSSNRSSTNSSFIETTSDTSKGTATDRLLGQNDYLLLIEKWIVTISKRSNLFICCCLIYIITVTVVFRLRLRLRRLLIWPWRIITGVIERIANKTTSDNHTADLPQFSDALKQTKRRKKKKKRAVTFDAHVDQPGEFSGTTNCLSAEEVPLGINNHAMSHALVSLENERFPNKNLRSVKCCTAQNKTPMSYTNASVGTVTIASASCLRSSAIEDSACGLEKKSQNRMLPPDGNQRRSFSVSEGFYTASAHEKKTSLLQSNVVISSRLITPFKKSMLSLPTIANRQSHSGALQGSLSDSVGTPDCSSDTPSATAVVTAASLNCCATPTTEQREKAYKELKQFQSAQIGRLIQMKHDIQQTHGEDLSSEYNGNRRLSARNSENVFLTCGSTSTRATSNNISDGIIFSDDYDFTYLLSQILDNDEGDDIKKADWFFSDSHKGWKNDEANLTVVNSTTSFASPSESATTSNFETEFHNKEHTEDPPSAQEEQSIVNRNMWHKSDFSLFFGKSETKTFCGDTWGRVSELSQGSVVTATQPWIANEGSNHIILSNVHW